MGFIAEHQGRREGPDGLRWGVESICAQLSELGLQIAPSTYYEQHGREPSRASRSATRSCKAQISGFTPATTASMAPAKCGWSSTGRASRWPAAPWSG